MLEERLTAEERDLHTHRSVVHRREAEVERAAGDIRMHTDDLLLARIAIAAREVASVCEYQRYVHQREATRSLADSEWDTTAGSSSSSPNHPPRGMGSPREGSETADGPKTNGLPLPR